MLADTFANFINGTITLFSDPTGVLIFLGGVIGGMLFGAIPGVSMLTLAAILLPFTAHLSPEHGIMLYSVIYCTGVYGGAITAILFNIPGAPENAPTAFDGYPMTLQGKAGKANRACNAGRVQSATRAMQSERGQASTTCKACDAERAERATRAKRCKHEGRKPLDVRSKACIARQCRLCCESLATKSELQ